MNPSHARTCLALAVLLLTGVGASSQTVAPAPPAPSLTDYSLDSSTLKGPVADSRQAVAAPYELSGTSISGSTGQASYILTAPISPDAAAYKLENGVYLYPSAFAGYGYNSNVSRTNVNPVGSSFFNVAPKVVAEIKHKGDRYTAVASVNRIAYSDSSPDNITTSEFDVAGDNYFSARARMGWAAGLVYGVDPRGSNNRQVTDSPDRWHTGSVNGRFIYGAPEAQGRVEVDTGYRSKVYDNNRTVNGLPNTELGDVNVASVAGRLFYRVGSRSLVLGEIRNDRANYQSALSTDSNTERRYYLGLTWDATAATTGIVKIGRATKDFDNGQTGYSGSSWEAAVRWMPRSYSTFELLLGRYPVDSSGVGTYDLNTNTSLTWSHSWTKSLTSAVTLNNSEITYGGTTQVDKINTQSLVIDYSILRWLKVGVDLSNTDYASNVPAAEYKRRVSMVTLNAAL